VTESFFEEQEEHSLIKSRIVSEYFKVWAKVIISTQKKDNTRDPKRVAYVDLFAGPGRYTSGQVSTPEFILRTAIEDADLRERLVSIFNDADPENANSLQATIKNIDGIERLRFEPTIWNRVVDLETAAELEEKKLVPTLFFVDPWGYKGLSLRLIDAVLKDWGCDCLFFFNFNRINMGLTNTAVAEHMNALFGSERADALRTRVANLGPAEREATVVNEVGEAFRERGREYVLPFGFRNHRDTRTKHYLIFVTKHPRGYTIMKDIMSKESEKDQRGVARFQYIPTENQQLGLLFPLTRPLGDLEDDLLIEFAGAAKTRDQIYEAHNVGKPFLKKHYSQALRTLEAEGRVTVEVAADGTRRNKGTFSNRVTVRFPK